MIIKNAKEGHLVPDVLSTARHEGIDPERLRPCVASGRAVILKNVNYYFSDIRAIGEGLKVKVNVNLSTSKDYIDLDEEFEKVRISGKYGAVAIAASSVISEMVKDKTLDEAMKITRQDVVDELGGLPLFKMPCSYLATDALHAAIGDYREKKGWVG